MLPLRPLRVFSRPFALGLSHLHSSSAVFAKKKVIQRFRLADIGEGITECEVIKWSVKPSSVVQSFDPLCEVQSDKASVEITSPFEGVIKDLLVKEGDVAKVGESLCLIEVEQEEDEAAANAPEPTPEPEIQSPPPQAQSPPPPAVESVATSTPRRPHPLDPTNTPDPRSSKPSRSDVLATPSVRHFARENGIDLANIPAGSGKGGRIEKKDVQAFLSGSSAPSQPEQRLEGLDKEFEVELGRTRFAMWKSMTKSLEIPHFGYSTALDLTRIHELLPTLNAHIPAIYTTQSTEASRPAAVSPHAILPHPPSPPTSDPTTHYTRLTYLPLLLKSLSRAMHEWPLFRSSLSVLPASAPTSKDKPKLTVRPHADIAIALSTPTGLYTPTLSAVDTLSTYAIMGRLRRLQHLGRQTPCGLGPAEMPRRGGTLTVSNVGAIGQGEYAAPLLVPGGGVAIVAIGRARWVDVVPEDGVGAARRRLVVGVSWSADHRIVEGAEMAAFVETWRGWVEHPERLVGEAA